MVELQTDDEKAEAVKKWWKENGVAVISGLALGLAVIFGWRGWTSYQERVGQQASLGFEELLITVAQAATAQPTATSENPNPLLGAAEAQQTRLRAEFGSTPYAFLGQLALAKAYNDQNDLNGAASALRDAIGQAPTPLFKQLAAVRLVRVLVAAENYPAATAVLDQHDQASSFAGDFAALRGDIAAAEGRIEDARTAYNLALTSNAAAPGLIRLKLQDLPAAAGS